MPRKIKKILLVDDNPVAQKMTQKVFENDGYQVFLAWDEEDCLRKARSEKPHVILMDVIFPDGDGREFVKKLEKDPQVQHIPIVFATNTINVEEDKGNLMITIGENSYRAFAKPLHYPKLLSAIRKEINRAAKN